MARTKTVAQTLASPQLKSNPEHGSTITLSISLTNSTLAMRRHLPDLFSNPDFTEASANAALELQDLLIKPTQRDIKRTVEGEIFDPPLNGAFDPAKAQIRLSWGSPETPEVLMSDLIAATTASVSLIRSEEFRKNAVKFGWELWDEQTVGQSKSHPDNSEERKGR